MLPAQVAHLKFLSFVPSRMSRRPPDLGMPEVPSKVSGYSILATDIARISSGEKTPKRTLLIFLSGTPVMGACV